MDRQSLHILLVEDDEDDYILTRELLDEAFGDDYQVTWSPTYEDGLQALEHTCADIVLVDYDLGARTGVDFLRQALSNHCHTAAILLTGYGNREVDLEAMRAGATDYLTKGELTPLLLERSIRYNIERQRTLETLEETNFRLAAANDLLAKANDLSARANERLAEANEHLAHMNDELEHRVAERTHDLADREARLKLLLTQLPALVWTTDTDLRLTSMLGRSLQEADFDVKDLIGHPVSELSDTPELRQAVQSAHEQANRGVSLGYETRLGQIDLQCYIEPFIDATGRQIGCIGVAHDITQTKQAEAQVRRTNRRLEALADFSRLLDEARLDSRRVLDTLASHIAHSIGDSCMVVLLEDGGDRPEAGQERPEAVGERLYTAAFDHRQSDALPYLKAIADSQALNRGKSYFEQVARTGKQVLINEVGREHMRSILDPQLWPYLDRFGSYSILIVPLSVHGQVIGALGVSRDRPGKPFTPEDVTFLEAIAGRAVLSIQNAELYETVLQQLEERRRMEAEISETQNRLIDSVEAERLKLAQELHDGPMQELYGLTYEMAALQNDCEGVQIAAALQDLQSKIQSMVGTLRAITREMRPPTLVPFGLEKAIRSHTEKLAPILPDLQIHLDLEPDGHLLSERLRLALYRIYQVSITNVIRHANAKNLYVRLRVSDQSVALEVEDDGCGFELPRRWVEMAREGHLGLVGAHERAEAIGGQLLIESQPNRGTLLRVEAPRSN